MQGYKQLISYKLADIAFLLGWEFVPIYYKEYEDGRQIVEGSSERSLSTKLKLYDVAKSSGMEALEDFEDILKLERLPRWSKDDNRLKKLKKSMRKKEVTLKIYSKNVLNIEGQTQNEKLPNPIKIISISSLPSCPKASAAWPALPKSQHEAPTNSSKKRMLRLGGFDDSWAYRQRVDPSRLGQSRRLGGRRSEVDVTNAGSAQTDYNNKGES